MLPAVLATILLTVPCAYETGEFTDACGALRWICPLLVAGVICCASVRWCFFCTYVCLESRAVFVVVVRVVFMIVREPHDTRFVVAHEHHHHAPPRNSTGPTAGVIIAGLIGIGAIPPIYVWVGCTSLRLSLACLLASSLLPTQNIHAYVSLLLLLLLLLLSVEYHHTLFVPVVFGCPVCLLVACACVRFVGSVDQGSQPALPRRPGELVVGGVGGLAGGWLTCCVVSFFFLFRLRLTSITP